MSAVKSLRDKMAANPEAYDFGGSKVAADVAEPVALALSVMLGGTGEPIVRKGIAFYPHSPELGILDELQAVIDNKAGLSDGKVLVKMACFIFYVKDEDGIERDATEKEVGKAFTLRDMPLIKDLMEKYCSMRAVETAEGNA